VSIHNLDKVIEEITRIYFLRMSVHNHEKITCIASLHRKPFSCLSFFIYFFFTWNLALCWAFFSRWMRNTTTTKQTISTRNSARNYCIWACELGSIGRVKLDAIMHLHLDTRNRTEFSARNCFSHSCFHCCFICTYSFSPNCASYFSSSISLKITSFLAS